ncbi:hypothetical protein JT359_20790 [Candidatus Poribacteria bacterium]|nr:hypothetical protein [Candidatus Poribacteria bacterium]
MNNDVEERLNRFKEDLNNLPSLQIVRKHIIFGECCILSQEVYFDLRSDVADHFGLHPNEVLVVGSAKLGFSVSPKKRYFPFGDKSDIDVALVSTVLFDKIWEDVFHYRYEGPYWPEYKVFVKYLFRGWIRPEMLPKSSNFPFRKKWQDFFRSITRSGRYGDYHIKGGLYQYLRQLSWV